MTYSSHSNLSLSGIIMYISKISEIKNSLKTEEMAFLSVWKVLACHPDLLPQHSWGILSSLIFLLWIEAWISQYWSQILVSASVSLMTIAMVHKFFRLIIRSRMPKYIIKKKNFYDFWIYNPIEKCFIIKLSSSPKRTT